jgi:hypothetical protein
MGRTEEREGRSAQVGRSDRDRSTSKNRRILSLNRLDQRQAPQQPQTIEALSAKIDQLTRLIASMTSQAAQRAGPAQSLFTEEEAQIILNNHGIDVTQYGPRLVTIELIC